MSELRRAFPYAQDESWILRVAQEKGWEEANRRYLGWQRDRGRLEMASLMDALDIDQVSTPKEALGLTIEAYKVFMPEEFEGSLTPLADDRLRIEARSCPTFNKIERANWHGVTACGSWHHRRGWYDALGVEATDTLIAEKKWGEEACVAEVSFATEPASPNE
jgi:hypothetical protein